MIIKNKVFSCEIGEIQNGLWSHFSYVCNVLVLIIDSLIEGEKPAYPPGDVYPPPNAPPAYSAAGYHLQQFYMINFTHLNKSNKFKILS